MEVYLMGRFKYCLRILPGLKWVFLCAGTKISWFVWGFLALGFAYHALNDIKIFFQEDIIKAPEQSVNYRLRIGTEITLYNEIKLRLGVKQKRGLVKNSEIIDWFNFKPLIGFEFPIKVWDNQFIYCAYALDPGAVNEGQSHIFSFSLNY